VGGIGYEGGDGGWVLVGSLEVAVRFGFAMRLAAWYLSYLITSSLSASFCSSVFRLLMAALAASDPVVVRGVQRLPKAGMWKGEPAA
jgi:hypothetical protein